MSILKGHVARFAAIWVKELLDRHVPGSDGRISPFDYGEELDFFCEWN